MSTQLTARELGHLFATAATAPGEHGPTAVVPPRPSAESDFLAGSFSGTGGDSLEGGDGVGSDGDSV